MVFYCFVKSCRNSTSKKKNSEYNISWHGLPKDKEIKKKWARALGVDSIPKTSRFCSKHFSTDCFVRIGLGKPQLKSDALPLFYVTPRTRSDPSQDMMVENDAALGNIDILEIDNYFEGTALASISPQSSTKKEDFEEASPSVSIQENNFQSLIQTPTKSAVNTIRYPGDVSEEKIKKMSLRTIVNSMNKLKKSCANKATEIKRLKRQQRCHLKKIETLQQLLTDLRKNDLISSSAHDVLEVSVD